MLGSRRRHASITRKEVPVLWPTVESDGERPRPPMSTNQRTTTDHGAMASNDRNRRPSRRADADQYATAQSQYSTTNSQLPMAAVATSSSSRLRTHDAGHDAYDLRTYLKRKTTDRRSPRSSEEKLYAPESAKQPRSAAYTRTGYPTTAPTPLGSSQTYYASNNQSSRDPVIPQRDRDREKAEARERKRSEREAAKARIEEEKSRVRAYERERERERERRREEKERQRAERERQKELERRMQEKEQERVRRHKEKERAREMSRPRDANTGYPHHSATAQLSAAAGALKQYAESKLSSRHQQADQIPSSSSNLALPQYGISTQPSSSGARVQPSTELRRDDSSQSLPPHVPAKDKKRHRPHRDRAAAQQSAQESGLSSSEQELSGRERPPRVTERRYTNRDPYDTHYSGPSGSENERNPRERVRKISRTHADVYGGDSSRPGMAPQVQGSSQPSAPVGSASFQNYVPQIVSIRAGQGPADPSTPQLRSKTPLVSNQIRGRDVQPGYSSASAQAQQAQPYSIQQSRHPFSQPPPDDVARLHNVLGTSGQAPLPPLPPDASRHHPSAEQLTGRPSYTPPSAQLPQPTITPRSMAPSLPKDPSLGRSHTMPPSADPRQLPPKAAPGYSPGKPQETYFSSDPSSQAYGYSGYPAHRAAISAEITLPTGTTALPDGSTQIVTVTQTTVQDLAAKFPLNEDMLTSASSSTLAGNSASANPHPTSSHTPPQPRRGSADQPRPPGNYAPDSMLAANWAPTPASQSKSLGGRQTYDENDVPIPIPAPRTNGSNPYQGVSQQSSRPQPAPSQPRGFGAYNQPDTSYGAQYASSRPGQNAMSQPPSAIQMTSSFHPSNHSPARSTQQTIKGSPASAQTGAQLAGATPKHSPSQRLHGRNGSTDTVQFAPPAKSSPNYTTKSVQPNMTNSQQAYVSSRTDTNPIRPTNATLEYPEAGRYRSQTPAYPSSAPPQQTTYLPSQTSVPNHQPQPTAGHHSRSLSNPVNQFQPPEPYAPPTRSNTIPQPSISTVAATAPSASAIVAAYRNRDHNTDSQSRYQDSANQRIPPRAAPSPAPTVTGRSYNAQPSSATRAGISTSNGPPQPPRGQLSQASTQQRPPGGPPPTTSGTHSRAQSDPQFNQSQPPPRVPVAGHLSTPAPPKGSLTLHPTPSETSLLKTPSSIAPSMLKGPAPPVRPPSAQASKPPKTSSKKGIFGLFRSRSSPPKPDARAPSEQPASAPAAPSSKPRQRSSSQTTINAVAASVRNIIAPHPAPQQPPRAPPPARAATAAPPIARSTLAADQERRGPPPSSYQLPGILSPTPLRAPGQGDDRTITGRRSPGTKMFTPFRLLSKHHRTVSSASVEALDGTAANTVIGGESARSSTAGRLSPPLRDPLSATQDWRNREEEELRDRGTYRRRRPGVVFDVVEEFTDTETHAPARKLSRGHGERR